MALPFDGGNFSNDLDCGTISGSQPTTTITYLYTTGNNNYNYFHHTDCYISSFSGNSRNFYKVNTSSNCKIIPDSGYKILNSGEGIIYTETTGDYNVQVKTFGGGTTLLPITAKNEWSAFTHTYYPDSFDPAQHLLIVYNTGNPESTNIKNYYLAQRTGFANANILGIGCDTLISSGEMIGIADYTGNVRGPILNFIQSNPTKPIRYVVLLYDIGLAFSGLNFAGNVDRQTGTRPAYNSTYFIRSVAMDLSSYLHDTSQYRSNLAEFRSDGHIYQSFLNGPATLTSPDNYLDSYSVAKFYRTPFLVTHITARKPAEVSGYIQKITTRGISSGYYLKGSGQNNSYMTTMPNFQTGVFTYCPSANLNYVPSTNLNPVIPYLTGGNLAGFVFRGIHDQYFDYRYAYNNEVKITGYNWYIMATEESFNFQNMAFTDNTHSVEAGPLAGQGTAYTWLRSGAFYSSGYENCPIGMVGHTEEPGTILNHYTYFVLWNSGLPFIEVAYRSRESVNAPKLWSCIGDPLLVK